MWDCRSGFRTGCQGILLEGLRRLEYRGYDSAGMAVINGKPEVQRAREVGKVAALADAISANPWPGISVSPIPAGPPTVSHPR